MKDDLKFLIKVLNAEKKKIYLYDKPFRVLQTTAFNLGIDKTVELIYLYAQGEFSNEFMEHINKED